MTTRKEKQRNELRQMHRNMHQEHRKPKLRQQPRHVAMEAKKKKEEAKECTLSTAASASTRGSNAMTNERKTDWYND
jgi:hypothetical protein